MVAFFDPFLPDVVIDDVKVDVEDEENAVLNLLQAVQDAP